MTLLRFAAFSDGDQGGNPAGVDIGHEPLSVEIMQRTAAEIGYSETAFAYRHGEVWRTRYFSPESEVAFCGHATIALGAALAMQYGDGRFVLELNDSRIPVEGSREGTLFRGRLRSPPTKLRAADHVLNEALALFGMSESDLAADLPAVIAEAGAVHLLLPLQSRKRLAEMDYDLSLGRSFMNAHGLVTIALFFDHGGGTFAIRNAFASGGVLEDPATGAAAAALGAYLRDHLGRSDRTLSLVQGEDMGVRCLIDVEIPPETNAGLFVSGSVRQIE